MITKCKDCNEVIGVEHEGKKIIDKMIEHDCKQQITFKHGGELSKKAQNGIINILIEEEAKDINIDFVKA